jgi:predicted transcriptional regulator
LGRGIDQPKLPLALSDAVPISWHGQYFGTKTTAEGHSVKKKLPELSRRERQIMDAIYRRGRATAAEVAEGVDDAPTLPAVRTTLRILEDKGHLRHEIDGVRHVYLPVLPREEARRSMLEHVTSTFFNGSRVQTMAALLGDGAGDMTDAELDRLQHLIDDARKRRSK